MSTAINSSTSSQEAYRNQRAERSMTSLTSSLKSAEKMASAIGADTSGLQSALQKVSGGQAQGSTSSTKVTLSPEGVARAQSENTQRSASAGSSATTSRPERQQFGSVDEAIAYGTSRAAEQASARTTRQTAANDNATTTEPARSTTASNRSERKQFASIDEALAYGASRAAEQAGSVRQTGNETTASNQASSTSEASNRSTRRQFNSVEDAISYGTQRALEQYNKQKQASAGV